MARRARKRGIPRLVVIFALSVLLPSIGLAALAWRSVAQEKRALSAERESSLRRAAWLMGKEITDTLTALKREEEARPYYQYNPLYVDDNSVGFGLNYVQSPIALTPPSPLVEGYFQIDPQRTLWSPNDPAILRSNDRAAQIPDRQGEFSEAQQKETARTLENGRQQGRFSPTQEMKTARTLENARQVLLPQLDRDREIVGRAQKGVFPGVPAQNFQQTVSKRTAAANVQSRNKVEEIRQGRKQVVADAEQEEQQLAAVEVVLSPFMFLASAERGLLAYRYVDVPNETKTWEDLPFLRYVQGFSIDEEWLLGTFLPDLSARYLDVPGARAALVLEGAARPPGRTVFDDAVALLPGYRLVVTDDDPGWVERRVSRMAAVLLASSLGLLLVISCGLLFTIRAVREEVRLAGRRSDFVSAVTHELRTPLTGIKMYADLLKAGWVKDDATRDEYVGFMADEADRLARLVNRVLDFARTDRGRRTVEPLDLAGPIREVERDFGPQMAEKGFDLDVRIEDDGAVLADPDAVKQILLNLLENAVKYATGAEDRTVTVRVAAAGDRTALTVEDHGPGIPPGERDRVFVDFYRTGEELTREASGTGIGLALVRRLAEGMDGRAEARETPGGGATLRVELRRA